MYSPTFAECALIVVSAPFGILLALGLIWVYEFIESFINEPKLKSLPPYYPPLSSLKVGDHFTIPYDEQNLWQVVYFGWQGVRVLSIGSLNWEWLNYDLPVKKFPSDRVTP